VLRPRSPPSIPAPSAHRCAAAGIDRDATFERWVLVPSTPRSVFRASSSGTCDLPGLGVVCRRDKLCHCLDLHVAVLQLPFIVLFQQHGANQPNDRCFVGEYADDIGPALHLLLYPGPVRQEL